MLGSGKMCWPPTLRSPAPLFKPAIRRYVENAGEQRHWGDAVCA